MEDKKVEMLLNKIEDAVFLLIGFVICIMLLFGILSDNLGAAIQSVVGGMVYAIIRIFISLKKHNKF